MSDLEGFNVKKLEDIEVNEKYQVEISNGFAALENLYESLEVNNACESIREKHQDLSQR
jgi:hypothetical protein